MGAVTKNLMDQKQLDNLASRLADAIIRDEEKHKAVAQKRSDAGAAKLRNPDGPKEHKPASLASILGTGSISNL